MRRLFLICACAVAVACPKGPPPDEQIDPPVEDASVDAGQPEVDAGRARFDAGTADAGFTTAASSTWCRDRALATCLRQVRCLSLSASGVDGCVVRAAELCDQLAFSTGVDAGRLRFDAVAGLDCLNGFGAGSCAREPPACADVFRGAVPADGGCVTAAECGPGTFCDLSRGTCPGRCAAFRAAGERCTFFERCEGTLACYPGDGGFETCQAPKDAGAPCVDFDECGADALCLGSVCVRRRADAGEACAISSGLPSCDEDSFCRQGPPPDAGDPFPPGVCQRRVGLGGTCVGSSFCQASLRCSTVVTTGTCLARVARGAACSSFNDCEDGLFCSNATQRCEPFPGDGGNCSYTVGSSGLCQPGFFCRYINLDDRRCEPRRAVGAHCDYDSECLSNDCEYGVRADGGFGGTCQVPCSLKADAGL